MLNIDDPTIQEACFHILRYLVLDSEAERRQISREILLAATEYMCELPHEMSARIPTEAVDNDAAGSGGAVVGKLPTTKCCKFLCLPQRLTRITLLGVPGVGRQADARASLWATAPLRGSFRLYGERSIGHRSPPAARRATQALRGSYSI